MTSPYQSQHESYAQLMALHRQSYETVVEALKLEEKVKAKGAFCVFFLPTISLYFRRYAKSSRTEAFNRALRKGSQAAEVGYSAARNDIGR